MRKMNANRQTVTLSPRATQEAKYNAARVNLLFVVGFTLVNMILTLTGSDTYFLFSAHVPYFITVYGVVFCGMMPTEFYTELGVSELELLPKSAIAVFVGIAAVLVAVYFVCWLLSKKRVGWLIAALSFFAIDTVLLILNYGIGVESIIDLLFHAWVIYYLIAGIVAHQKLKKLPAEEPVMYMDTMPGDYVAPSNEGDGKAE